MSLKRGLKFQKIFTAFLICGTFLFSAIIILSPKPALALHSTSTYNKLYNGTLTYTDWNGLLYDTSNGSIFGDFVNTWLPARMNGPLGIATSSPTDGVMLDVAGTVRAYGFLGAITGTINAANVSPGSFGANVAPGNFGFPTGSLGVGIGMPTQTLHVQGAAGLPATSGTTQNGLFRLTNSTNDLALDFGQMSVSPWTSWIQNTNKTSLDQEYPIALNPNGGTVGIGTTNPTNKLTIVNEEVSSVAPVQITGYYNGATAQGQTVNRVARGTQASPTATQQDDIMGGFAARGYGTTAFSTGGRVQIVGAAAQAFTDSAQGTYIKFLTTPTGSTTISEKMRITGDGNIGIGTTAPTAKLHVVGTSALSTIIDGVAGNYLSFKVSGSDYAFAGVGGTVLSGAPTGSFGLRSEGNLILGANGNNLVMTLNGATGNVGIGTTNPGAKLQVNPGNIHATSTLGGSMYVMPTGADGSGYGSGIILGHIRTDVNAGAAISSVGGGVGDSDAVGLAFFTHDANQTNNRSEVMRINYNGNVGIGTTTPAYKLVVSGEGSFGGYQIHGVATPGVNTDAANKLYVDSQIAGGSVTNADTVDLYHVSGAANYITKFNSSNNTIASSLIYDNGTNIGVGTTNPAKKLEVFGDIALSNGGKIGQGNGWGTNGNTYNATLELYSGSTGYTTLQAATAYGLLLNPSGGNVGIGLTNPSYKLDVYGAGNFGNNQVHGVATPGANTDAANKLYVDSQIAGGTVSNADTVDLYHVGGAANYITKFNSANNTVASSLIYDTGTNVGIGITNPSYKLDLGTSNTVRAHSYYLTTGSVQSNGSSIRLQSNNDFTFDTPTSGNVVMTLKSGGNVGIGTTTPAYKLDVYGVGNFSNNQIHGVATPAANTDAANKLYVDSQIAGGTVTNADTVDLYHVSGAANYITKFNSSNNTVASSLIYDTGTNVGIGTTAPGTKLEVLSSATGYVHPFYITNTSSDSTAVSGMNIKLNGTERMYVYSTQSSNLIRSINDAPLIIYTNNSEKMRITSGGNVGIGTTNPNYLLEVDGTSDFGGTTTFGNGAKGLISWSATDFIVRGQSGYGLQLGSGGTSARLIIDTSGNVGIGTTTPAYKLDVYGVGNFSNNQIHGVATPAANTDAANKLYVDSQIAGGTVTNADTVDLYHVSGAANYITKFNSSNNTVASSLVYDTGTNVGIGTTNPGAKLDIIGPDTNNADLLKIVSNAGTRGTFSIRNGTGVNPSFLLGTQSTSETLGIMTAGSERVRIDATGNVGIGTTTPTEKLEVNGKLKVGNNTISGENITFDGSTTAGMRVTNPSGYISITPLNSSWAHIYTDRPRFIFNTEVQIIGGVLNAYNNTDLRLGTATGAEKMRITTTGNVGIGTTTPAYKLDVYGVGNFNNNQIHGVATPAANTDAANKLYVDSQIAGGTVTNADTVDLYHVSGAANYITKFNSSNNTVASSLVYDTGTNVGIGTTNPGAKLDVLGTGYFGANTRTAIGQSVAGDSIVQMLTGSNYFDILNNTSGSLMRVRQSDGYVGIGTTAPGQKLDVIGSIKASTNIYAEGALYTGKIGTDGHVYFARSSDGSTTGLIGYSGSDLLIQQGGGFASKILMGPSGIQFQTEDSTSPYNKVTRMIIRHGDTGNVGIGTTTPAYKLDVYGVGNFNNNQIHGVATPAANTDAANKLYVDSQIAGGTVTNADTVDLYHVGGAANYITKFNSSNNTIASSLIYDNGTSVGIGLTNPSYPLHVSGAAYVTGAIYGLSSVQTALIYPTGSTDLVIQTRAGLAKSIIFKSNGTTPTETMRLDGSGNVGIGTTSPAYKLDVVGSAKATQLAAGVNPVGSYALSVGGTGIYISGAGPINWNSGDMQIIPRSYAMAFDTYTGAALTEKMRITGGGNVGIGTTTPAYKLDVYGVGNFSNSQIHGVATPAANTDAANKLYVDSQIAGGTVTNADTVDLYHVSGAANYITKFNSSNNTVASSLVYDNGTNVGIGTTNPLEKLDLRDGSLYFSDSDMVGNGTSTAIKFGRPEGFASNWYSSIGFYATTGYDRLGLTFGTSLGTPYERMRITPEGNVGIGTTTPDVKLQVIGGSLGLSNNQAITWRNASGMVNDGEILLNNLNQLVFQSGTGDATIFNSNNGTTEWMRIVSGNVGIGTTTPAYKLDVYGVGNFSNNQIHGVATPAANTDAANKLYVDSQIAGGTVTNADTVDLYHVSGAANYITKFNSSNNTVASSLIYDTGTNVGIGVTNPGTYDLVTSKMEVKTTSGHAGMTINSPTDAIATLILAENNDSTWHLLSRGDSSNRFELFSADGTLNGAKLTVLQGGNVGIGTTTPAYKLDVYGAGNFSNNQVHGVATPGANTDAANKLYVDSQIAGGTVSNADTVDLYHVSGAANYITKFNSSNNTVASSLIYDTGTNVGIGLSTPTSKLSVAGAIAITSSATLPTIGIGLHSNGYLYSSGGTAGNVMWADSTGNTAIYLKSTNDIDFNTNNVTRIKVASTGNVGIGTTTPSYKLDVYGVGNFSNNQIHGVATPGANTDAANKLYVDSQIAGGTVTNADTVDLYHVSGAANYITKFNSSNNTVASSLVYDNGTNVGIGTTNPTTALEVNGTVTATGFSGSLAGTIIAANVASGVFGANLAPGPFSFGGGTSNVYSNYQWIGATYYGPSDFSPQLVIRQDNATTSINGFKPALTLYNDNGSLNSTVGLAFVSKESNTGGNSVELAGIMAVKESAGTSGGWSQGGLNFFVKNYGTKVDAMYIKNDGSVGIGTTNPEMPLDVEGVIRGASAFISKYGANANSRSWRLTHDTVSFGDFALQQSTTQTGSTYDTKMYFGNTGNVGIGTTAPGAYKLKVVGDVAITGALLTQTGSDFAEEFKADAPLEPGTVVVMGSNGYKSVKSCEISYDKTVVGIISDNPSIIAGRTDIDKESPEKVIVAMMGVVTVKVSDVNGQIEKGDLLTSSNLKGYAMKARSEKQGTIIGKALEDLNVKKGKIKVLVNLQ